FWRGKQGGLTRSPTLTTARGVLPRKATRLSKIFAYMSASAVGCLRGPRGRGDDAKMSYFRTRFANFEEFQREGFFGADVLGKEELELLQELEDDDDYERPRTARTLWD